MTDTLTHELEAALDSYRAIANGKNYTPAQEIEARKSLSEELHDISRRVLADKMQELAEQIVRENPHIESVVNAQGLDFIRATNGSEIPRENFPQYDAMTSAYEDLYPMEPGIYVTRKKKEA